MALLRASSTAIELQQRADPIYQLVLTGTARRVHWAIDAGELALLRTINGEKAEDYLLHVDMGSNELKGDGRLYKTYKRQWTAVYAMPSPKVDFKVQGMPNQSN